MSSNTNHLQKPKLKQRESYVPISHYVNGMNSQISERQTIESTSNSNAGTDSEKQKLPRQNSLVVGRVAPLNYKRRSKSPRFDQICSKYGNLNKQNKAKTSTQNYDDIIVVNERRATQGLPPKPREERIYSIENHEALPAYHQSRVPENHIKRSLRNLDSS